MLLDEQGSKEADQNDQCEERYWQPAFNAEVFVDAHAALGLTQKVSGAGRSEASGGYQQGP